MFRMAKRMVFPNFSIKSSKEICEKKKETKKKTLTKLLFALTLSHIQLIWSRRLRTYFVKKWKISIIEWITYDKKWNTLWPKVKLLPRWNDDHGHHGFWWFLMVNHVLSWSTIKYHQVPLKEHGQDHGQPWSGNVTPWSTMLHHGRK